MKQKACLLAMLLGMMVAVTACSDRTQTPETWTGGKNVKAAAINVRLSAAYLQQGDTEQAKRKILLAMDQAPNWPPALDGMAYYLAQTGNKSQAEDYYQRAIRIAGDKGDIQNNYGVFLCENGKYQAAINRFMEAVKDPNYVKVASAYENAGMCAEKIPNQKLAAQYFKKALQNDPNTVKSLINMSELAFNFGQYRKSRRYLNRYLDLTNQAQTPQSLWLKVRLARRSGKLNLAASDALLLRSKFPNSKEASLSRASEQS